MRILAINVSSIPNGEESNLWNANVLQDYDVVIVAPEGLEQLFSPLAPKIREDSTEGHIYTKLGKLLADWNEKRSKEISGLLKNGGIVVCFMFPVAPYIAHYGRNRAGNLMSNEITNYDWLVKCEDLNLDADDIIFGTATGERLELKEPNHPFAEYLRTKPASRTYIEDLERYVSHDWKILASAYGTHALSLIKRIGRGYVILLPSYYDSENGALIEKCLIKLLGDREPRSMPGWAKSILVPGQEQLILELAGVEGKIEELTVQRNDLNSQNSSLERWKWLLYETGKEYLEPVVREALSLLGCNIELQLDKDSDGLINSEFGIALLEVEGANDTIRVGKIRQLMANIANYKQEKEVLPTGILVGNPFRENKLDERPPEGSQKQPFSKELLEAAEKHDIAVLLSTDLYRVVTKILKGEFSDDEKKQLREKIITGKGLVKID